MNGIESIAAERTRQVEAEGWTLEHDDAHTADEIPTAALGYLSSVVYPDEEAWSHAEQRPPHDWPWDSTWWKPKDRRSDLVRAGALIAAEIDRMDRAENARINAEGWQDAPGRIPDYE